MAGRLQHGWTLIVEVAAAGQGCCLLAPDKGTAARAGSIQVASDKLRFFRAAVRVSSVREGPATHQETTNALPVTASMRRGTSIGLTTSPGWPLASMLGIMTEAMARLRHVPGWRRTHNCQRLGSVARSSAGLARNCGHQHRNPEGPQPGSSSSRKPSPSCEPCFALAGPVHDSAGLPNMKRRSRLAQGTFVGILRNTGVVYYTSYRELQVMA